ncbi:MAG: ankyrin repeat domain-containing protein [Myxococcota bacterium]|nr:ankyrin repeat domain-containing protein [Myxococcota bacterium]
MKAPAVIGVVLMSLGCQDDRDVNRIMGTGEVTRVTAMADGDQLRRAVREGRRNDVEAMLRAGTDASEPDKLGATPLVLAARHNDDVELARLLHAAAPATLEVGDSLQRTPLSWAASSGHDAVCSFLLGLGAAVEARDATGKTPLFHAVLTGKARTARRLIAHGADVDARDGFGDTALMMAASKDHRDMVELLLRAGASRAPRDEQGRTALERTHDEEVKQLLAGDP